MQTSTVRQRLLGHALFAAKQFEVVRDSPSNCREARVYVLCHMGQEHPLMQRTNLQFKNCQFINWQSLHYIFFSLHCARVGPMARSYVAVPSIVNFTRRTRRQQTSFSQSQMRRMCSSYGKAMMTENSW